jgi:membrane-bound serine protease (ClpP class)
VIVPVVAGIAAVLVFLVRLAVAAQLRKPATGAAGMVGETGTVLEAIPAGGTGRVLTHGEVWTAWSSEAIAEGAEVEVVAVEGLRATVRPAPPPGARLASS